MRTVQRVWQTLMDINAINGRPNNNDDGDTVTDFDRSYRLSDPADR